MLLAVGGSSVGFGGRGGGVGEAGDGGGARGALQGLLGTVPALSLRLGFQDLSLHSPGAVFLLRNVRIVYLFWVVCTTYQSKLTTFIMFRMKCK